MRSTGLVRVTIVSPRRRIDMALPEGSLVAELLPSLLQHAGEGLADETAGGGGWTVRRINGHTLALERSLGSYRLRDGEILYLVPRSVDWPELEYDDLVEAIATSAGGAARMWSARHTRSTGLALGAASVLLVFAALLQTGPPWIAAAAWSWAVAGLLVVAGSLVSRATGDSSAGALLGAVALPFAAAGGAFLLTNDEMLDRMGVPQLLTASAAMVLVSVLGLLGIADRPALFSGALFTGLLGVGAGWLTTTDALEPYESAAIVVGALLLFSPILGQLSVRLSRVPMPILPRTTADLVRDDPQPPRSTIHLAVLRADALLTGLLLGTGVVATVGLVVLVGSGRPAAFWYTAVVTTGFLLRARLYPAVRHRLPMLVAGAAGATSLVVGPLTSAPENTSIVVVALLATGGLAVLAGLLVSTRPLNPYLGRSAEILELVVLLAVVPLSCAVLGLYEVFRGLGG